MMENLVKFSGFYSGGQHRKEGSPPPPPPPPTQRARKFRGEREGEGGRIFSLFTAETINFRIIV